MFLLFICELQQQWFRLLSKYDGFTVILPVCQAKSCCGCDAKRLSEWESRSLQNSGRGHEGITFCGRIHGWRVLFFGSVSPEES
jgi:hypothetical protein